MKLLITGSSGLIGSECVAHFHDLGHKLVGVDNNMRAVFFGPSGDTRWNQRRLEELPRFRHVELDVRDRAGVMALFKKERFDGVIHTAAQPSHDRAAAIPLLDFETNALGTVNLIEANRQHSAEAPFVHLSTNKVYGDRPNTLELVELEARYEFAEAPFRQWGIPEDFPIDQSKHSLFGASKVAADVMVQEYGRYFGMPTACLRGGCLTGPAHAGVQLHGFLSYLVKCCLDGTPYTVFGYEARQVRDNIHALDVARFIERFLDAPKSGAVYNLGGGKGNAISMQEAFKLAEEVTGNTMNWSYSDEARVGDHICYYSDLRRMQADYPGWTITKTLPQIVEEIAASWAERLHAI